MVGREAVSIDEAGRAGNTQDTKGWGAGGPTEGFQLGVTWLDSPYEEPCDSGRYNEHEGSRFSA